jgi:hypothetical protein
MAAPSTPRPPGCITPKGPTLSDNRYLELIQRIPIDYYEANTNFANGLVADRTEPGAAASIAAVAMALATVPLTVEMKLKSREQAAQRVLTSLRFFRYSKQGVGKNSTGYNGFYYHFLNMKTGLRFPHSELSTIDTTLLIAGMLTCATYFDGNVQDEIEIRELTDQIYSRVNWRWATNGQLTVTNGWYPKDNSPNSQPPGFITYRWTGYDEALILYVLALGSPNKAFALDRKSYEDWTKTYTWKKAYGIEYLFCGPLFTHQFSHMWIDFKNIQDDYMKTKQIDYFENSRRATLVHQQYAINNPKKFVGYGEHCWGITACNGPNAKQVVDGKKLEFLDYEARGAPAMFQNDEKSGAPDDGTIAPWAAFASLPFAPEIVMPTINFFEDMDLGVRDVHGYRPSFNQTFKVPGGSPAFWVSPWKYGIDQGPIVLMVENYQTGFLWELMKKCEPIVNGLKEAGFTGGWLNEV